MRSSPALQLQLIPTKGRYSLQRQRETYREVCSTLLCPPSLLRHLVVFTPSFVPSFVPSFLLSLRIFHCGIFHFGILQQRVDRSFTWRFVWYFFRFFRTVLVCLHLPEFSSFRKLLRRSFVRACLSHEQGNASFFALIFSCLTQLPFPFFCYRKCTLEAVLFSFLLGLICAIQECCELCFI